ncbi:MAG: lasso peptide biosynthesis B2 protein [Pseudonocardiales bacterium]|nr:lasso peptide biosynthesis B2 protein [Pseudonocardiales bacterium]
MPQHLACPDYIHAIDTGRTVVLVDFRRASTYALTGEARRIWLALSHARECDETRPEISGDVVGELRKRGLLYVTTQPYRWRPVVCSPPSQASWGTQTVPVRLEQPSTSDHFSLAATAALAITLAVRHLGTTHRALRRLTCLARWATTIARREASVAEAEKSILTVRRTARLWPARIACLEESIAATLALALTGRRATWCHGVATDPIALHAWIEVGGSPAAEPPSTERFTAILRIHGNDHTERRN